MANIGSINVPVAPLLKRMTLTIKVLGVKRMNMRIWIALKIMRFGTFILGTQFAIEFTDAG